MNTSVNLADLGRINNFNQANFQRYVNFLQRNPELSLEEIVLYVNIGLDRDFYENISFVQDPYYIRVLVNKFYRLDSDFSPGDLVQVAPGHRLREVAALNFLEMQAQMAEENLPVIVRSAYRSYSQQTFIYQRNVDIMGQAAADRWSARPGHSEHQTGLALDVLQPGTEGLTLGNANFENTEQYQWLLANAHNFGFILRYPASKEHITGYAFEPWHLRYVGAETATYMIENNVPTFEHYLVTRFEQDDDQSDILPAANEEPPEDPGYTAEADYLGVSETTGFTEETETPFVSWAFAGFAGISFVVLLILSLMVLRVRIRRRLRRAKRAERIRRAGKPVD